jgi:hypothetical protein
VRWARVSGLEFPTDRETPDEARLRESQFIAMFSDMDKEGKPTRWKNYRHRLPEPKYVFPEIPPYPADALLTPKQVGYLHVRCQIPIAEVIAHYAPRADFGDIYLGLHYYYKNKRAYDEEIAKDVKFNTAGSLKDVSVRLPSAGLSSLVDCMQFEEPLLANRRVERPGK